jgi:hypothetical protein
MGSHRGRIGLWGVIDLDPLESPVKRGLGPRSQGQSGPEALAVQKLRPVAVREVKGVLLGDLAVEGSPAAVWTRRVGDGDGAAGEGEGGLCRVL